MTAAEFNTCVDLYADNLYRFILKNVRDKDSAKDIVQDTFEKLWNKVTDMESSNAKSYMFTTAYRTMIDHIRKNKRVDRMDEQHDVLQQSSNSYSDLKDVLSEALDRLPEMQKSVIMLRDYEGYDYKEIGEITGLSESQVKVYIFRGRQTLKTYLGSLNAVI